MALSETSAALPLGLLLMLARRRTQHRSDRLCDLGAIEVVRFAQSVILDQHIDHHFVRLDRVDREMRARMSPEVGPSRRNGDVRSYVSS